MTMTLMACFTFFLVARVQQPQECDACAANGEEEELPVAMFVIRELVDKDLWARDVDECAAWNAKHDWGHQDWLGLETDADADARRLDQRQDKENEEYSFLRFSLMLSKSYTKRYASDSVVNGHSYHEIYELPNCLLHS